MSSTYGENLKLSIFGQSHGAAIGMTLDGIPAGLPVDTDALQVFLNRPRSERLVNAAKGSRPAGISLRNSGRLHLRRAHCRRHLQQKHPLRGLCQSEGLPPSRSCGFHRPDQIRRISGRRRRRTLFRPSDRAALHCGRTVQTVAGGHGNSGFRPYCRHCGHFRHAL